MSDFECVIKAVIEKLLRSAPQISKIYVLTRARGDGSATDRLEDEVIKSTIFDRLRQEREAECSYFLRSKLHPVPGDVSLPMLGLSTEDQRMLQDTVAITKHSATTFQFNDPLDVAVKMNCVGAMNMLTFVKICPHLQCPLPTSAQDVKVSKHEKSLFLPALILKKGSLRSISRRAKSLVKCLGPFGEREWIFHADSNDVLASLLKSNDEEWWIDAKDIDWERYILNYCVGLKKYMLNEDVSKEDHRLSTLAMSRL